MFKQSILVMREYLINKWFFKNKFISVFVYLFIASFLLGTVVCFIYTMNYNYNIKLLDFKLGNDFMIGAIVCGCAFLISLIFGIYLHTFIVSTVYLMHKFNDYAPKNPLKKLNKTSFRLAFYFYTKNKKQNDLKYSQFDDVYLYIINYNQYKQSQKLIYGK
ncbi:hypothetical protein [Ureaplasma diversum]|uniref:Uncharacterized protein n=1 Tax=Ureaplasma diversum NCTC 246 TaxID=1188241 RepID=A0A084EZR1_9BACT|nr:hypothetical protein [Ureaplasma diversum]KEZ23453.1 Hypothetical protein, predicted transmembrane protein [Ureaplasma diversum NCTC 246]